MTGVLKLQKYHFEITADFFVNLGAGWLISAFTMANDLVLTISVLYAILSIVLAFSLRERAKIYA